ncbi:hypothetical protein AGR2A_Cc140071 [Agrobacterium genomosp. 2 str. CFBP 5494]|uniref:Uncharacterized protein n=1 Tax=Agrobacterium genomosp. 2 str. CFBP 5494 TaxID=1183436 RepID=A0A9W5AZA1_9HYPH|nr:hypothetical protein AGR2A_Cc140071 [Agrobacterium genomosp. 2 str. CFBP 5494]
MTPYERFKAVVRKPARNALTQEFHKPIVHKAHRVAVICVS